jgi:hypothetical protein
LVAYDRYIVDESPVGQGGFGKVRLGKDTILERKIAVKKLDPVIAEATGEDKERFRREARTLAKLSHPNIPAIYDVVFTDNHFEFIFQFVEGQTLRRLLEEEEALQLTECRAWFDQIASALQHAHDNGIIHRDIKPENLIVSLDRKHCYLVDFGIALSRSEVERLTGSDNWIGTPGYMSPEHIEGEDLDPSDDLYVLGICLYECLSGHKLEPGDYKPLTAINELIPPTIDDLVRKCIAPKPRRMKSATDFRNQLRSALHGHKTLSEVLFAGQLHEVVGTIAAMTPARFTELKVAQRLLVLQKCCDIVQEKDGRLAAARNEFLAVMTRLGVQLHPDEYERVAIPAVRHGLGIVDDNCIQARGIPMIRDALIEAASQVETDNHRVIVKALISWLSGIVLDQQKSGLYHSLRQLIYALMANPECHDEDAPPLAKALERINQLQRSKAYEAEASLDTRAELLLPESN